MAMVSSLLFFHMNGTFAALKAALPSAADPEYCIAPMMHTLYFNRLTSASHSANGMKS
ncbi:hypothetical protein AZ22_1801 [Bordetella bronchiseptica 980-2]|nr:hypothetical protein L576_1896 [Bordetella bronchiseptica OSU054]KAK63300.1 hypothetical protein AZ22_1801 [Bordetella bronchiseptica 980-2]KAK65054.1 hypothetical protein L530_1773 [Bordetella bronchiseptica MO211]KAK75289.1 hypothetical protein L507_1773 [Bordetella bronchiseptica CA90 BB02]KCV40371.1 hypothetical protein L572_1903 [Bordetella bronchiseptica 345]KCV46386.1 hypothetical protein L491_1856 [Bordetella bronchiseptica 3E44]KCV50595.1 hypothetical protein L492_1800 [Bordetella